MSKFEELYGAKILKTDSGCWEWQGALYGKGGYGCTTWQGKNYRTHRLAYTLDCGPIPQGLFVCHTCDNRRCCNPNHLWLGTAKDNRQDCVSKGRTHKSIPAIQGEQNHASKLTTQDVIRIRQMRDEQGISYTKLGRIFNVNSKTVIEICNRATWKHI